MAIQQLGLNAYEESTPKKGADNEELLEEIRTRYAYAEEAWREIYKERRIDLKYISGDPWSAEDRKARKDAQRPCISHDELSQYVNQAINNLRQNKRGIKIDPDGSGADEQTAELEQDLVRTIEYRSNAQSAYITAYQAQLEGSLGFFRIGRKYAENENLTAENFDHQELTVQNIQNAEVVLYDPDTKQADWSDANYCFVLDPLSKDEFKRRYPKAEIRDFTNEHLTIAKDWLGNETVLVAEYWKVTTTQTRQYLLDSGAIVDKLAPGVVAKSERLKKSRSITQYVTNGIEILGSTPEPGITLPIIPVVGKEMYVDENGVSKRMIMSLVRLARDPQMSLAYLVTQELEEAGLSPKVPWLGYVGQFETDSETWTNLTKIPAAMAQADPVPDGSSGNVLPLPTRVPFTPNFQAYEIAKDSARRAIQAAMGISSLPTAAQRDNQKSGVAIERIQTAQDVGSFHFLDNFDRSLMMAGRVMDERMDVVYGQTDREMVLAKADDKHRKVKLNTEAPYMDEASGKTVHFPVGKGSHSITVSAAPSYASQREAVGNFLDQLISNLKNLPVAPPQAAKILAMAIQMKELGPKGDQIADIISPPAQPGQEQQAMQQMQAQHAQLVEVTQKMTGEIQKLQLEKAGHVIQGQMDMAIEKMKIEAQIAAAEINTKAQNLSERMQFVEDAWKQLHGQAADAALQASDQAHQQGMQQSQQGADADSQQSQQDAAADSQQSSQDAAAEQQQPAD
jgi:portal protein